MTLSSNELYGAKHSALDILPIHSFFRVSPDLIRYVGPVMKRQRGWRYR